MEFAFGIDGFKLLETLEGHVSAKFLWPLNCKCGFFSEDYVFGDVKDRVEFYNALGAEGSAHFLLDFLGCVVDEYACLWLTL